MISKQNKISQKSTIISPSLNGEFFFKWLIYLEHNYIWAECSIKRSKFYQTHLKLVLVLIDCCEDFSHCQLEMKNIPLVSFSILNFHLKNWHCCPKTNENEKKKKSYNTNNSLKLWWICGTHIFTSWFMIDFDYYSSCVPDFIANNPFCIRKYIPLMLPNPSTVKCFYTIFKDSIAWIG